MTDLPFQPPLEAAEDQGRQSSLDLAMATFPDAEAGRWLDQGGPESGRFFGWLQSWFRPTELPTILPRLRRCGSLLELKAALRVALALRLAQPPRRTRRRR